MDQKKKSSGKQTNAKIDTNEVKGDISIAVKPRIQFFIHESMENVDQVVL